MAFADHTTGGRVIEWASVPVKVTLSEAVEVGDLLGYESGWYMADGNDAGKEAMLVAGEAGASAAEIVAYRECLIDFSSGCTGTAGAAIYLSDTDGEYGTTAGTNKQIVGHLVDARRALISPAKYHQFNLIKEDDALYFGDVGVSISSTGDGMLRISADHSTSAAAINLSDPVTFSDNITMAAGKKIYIKGTGAVLASTAAGKVTLAATGSGADDFSINCTTTFGDNITMASGKKIILRGTGAILASTAAGKITLAATGAGADDFTLNCTVKFADDVTFTTAKAILAATASNSTVAIKAYGSTGVAFNVVQVQSATGTGGQTKVKLGFFGATPVVKQSAIVASTSTNVSTQLNTLLTQLQSLGLTTAT